MSRDELANFYDLGKNQLENLPLQMRHYRDVRNYPYLQVSFANLTMTK
jgi:hypothetical protein